MAVLDLTLVGDHPMAVRVEVLSSDFGGRMQ
jgi:hypothetical protein